MPTITDTGICIRRWDFSETSQTVSIFTREHGIIRALAKGAKRTRGSFSGGLDVLTRGHLAAIVKPGRDLSTLTEWHLEATYRALRQSLAANRAGLYMADLVHHMLTGHDPYPELFDELANALEKLADPAAIDEALLRFQWALLVQAGYQPELDRDAESGEALSSTSTFAFSPRAGGLVADTGSADRWRVRGATIDLLRDLATGRPVASRGGEAIMRANRLLASYCREIAGRDFPTLRWAFSDAGPP